MKLPHILPLFALALLALLSDCKCGGTKNDPNPRIGYLKSLAGTWKVSATNVTLDNKPQTGYENFTLTITGTDDQAVNGNFGFTTAGLSAGFASPWDKQGTFSFAPDAAASSKITRKDDVTIDYAVVSNTLTLKFNYQGSPYTAARTSEVKGQWVFVLTK